MKSSNTILRTAIALALGSVAFATQAGTLSSAGGNTGTLFATQIFGSTAVAGTEVVPQAVTYTFSNTGGINVAANGTIYVYLRLANGAKFTSAPNAGDFAGSVVGVAKLGAGSVGAPALSTDSTTVVVPLTNKTAANAVIAVGDTLVWTPAANRAVNTVSTVLNTAGGTVGITGSADLTKDENAATLPSGLDGGVAPQVNIATAKNAITATVTASSALTPPEAAKIDIAPPALQTKFTGFTAVNGSTATLVNLGTVKYDNVAGVKGPDGATDFTIANSTQAGGTAIITGSFAAVAANGLAVYATPNLAGGAVATFVLSGTGKTTGTISNLPVLAAGATYSIGYAVDGTTIIPSTTPALTVTPKAAAGTTYATVVASGNLYALATNGSSVDVRGYVPAAAAPYQSYLRIINTGSIATPVTVALINPDTGAVGTAGTLITSLAAGAAQTLTATQVETALGGPLAATLRPRVRIAGTTTGLTVQNYLTNPDGTFSEVSGGQDK